MSNETNPGTVIGRNMAAHSIQFGNGNRVFMKITADGELIVNDATEAAKALKAEWDKLFPERPAAHSQPAATVQEAIDFKYWLMDAARILRSNGTDTHASWVEKALAALTAEPAAKAGDADDALGKLKHKLWMIICHASGGRLSKPEDVDRSVNDICVQITAKVNDAYEAGKQVAAPSPQPDMGSVKKPPQPEQSS